MIEWHEISEDLEEESHALIYRLQKQCSDPITENATVAIKYIMPDDPKYKEDMIKL